MLRLSLLILALALPASAETPAKQLFGAQKTSSAHRPESFGGYAKGCLAGAMQLPETGPSWQAMRLKRNRNWGHPETIAFIGRLGAAAQEIGWPGIYVGDISQPRGGPMLTGHRSHQVGLDADIWMLRPQSLTLSRQQREEISSISIRSKDQRSTNGNWTVEHMEILRAAAQDPAVARIFVTAPAKLAMCKAETGNRSYLRKIRPWWGHHYHFHVRLACPRGERGCVDQAPPPPGDGCEDALWWVTDALKPAKPDPNAPPPKPRAEITLSALPAACTRVLEN